MSDPYSASVTAPGWNPDTKGIKAFTDWYNQHGSSMTGATAAKYAPYIQQMQSVLGYNASTGQWGSNWPTYNPVQWGDSSNPNSYAGQYAGYQQGMQGLLSRLGAGPQASDMQNANDTVGQSYGYSPASWTAIQQGLPDRLNASNVMNSAASIALGLQESPFGQQQQQAIDVAMRQAEAQVGKQLEAIFGERGGLAGFQAAYDMTSQLQSTYLQQQTQSNMALLDRSLSAVNAENGYFQQLVNNGAIQAQDYVKFRWDTLQNGYQDYMAAMDQTMKNWTTSEQVSEQQYNQQAKVITDHLNAITGAMAQDMGLDDWLAGNAKAWYDFWSGVSADYEAANPSSQQTPAPVAPSNGPGLNQVPTIPGQPGYYGNTGGGTGGPSGGGGGGGGGGGFGAPGGNA